MSKETPSFKLILNDGILGKFLYHHNYHLQKKVTHIAKINLKFIVKKF